MAAKIEPGTYQCKTTAATIYEAPSGAVMCRIGVDLGLTGGICLIQKDGTLSERGFRDAAAILGIVGPWDWALWEREPGEWAGHDVEAVVTLETGDKGEYSSVKYLNPPGGAGMAKADAKVLAAKYGAKTRALFGGVPAAAKPTAAKPKPTPPKAPPPPAPKPTSGLTSTMELCWERWLELGGNGEPEAWYAVVTDLTGKNQNDCTPEDWGKMFANIDGLPF
jgi:hypothetical protein